MFRHSVKAKFTVKQSHLTEHTRFAGYKSVYVEQTVDVEPQIQTVQYRAIPVDSLQEKLPDGLNDVNIKFYVDSRNYAAHVII